MKHLVKYPPHGIAFRDALYYFYAKSPAMRSFIFILGFLFTVSTATAQSSIVAPEKWPVQLDTLTNTASVNWEVMKELILSSGSFLSKAGQDSVDYIGQVYYATPYKVKGFRRTAIKRVKTTNEIFYESYFETKSDSETVRTIFFALYNALKKSIKENTGEDFFLVSSAKKPISASPVSWIAQWNISKYYKTLPAGLGDVKIGLMLSGMKDVFNNDRMRYTIKIFIGTQPLHYDLFGWDTPK
jgi:hypothetical protein